jgi:hypothetical protein
MMGAYSKTEAVPLPRFGLMKGKRHNAMVRIDFARTADAASKISPTGL